MKVIIFCGLLLLTVLACNSEKKIQTTALNGATPILYKGFQLKPGDILFQDSDCGPFCESIEKVTFGFQGSKFSHVGMLIPKGKAEFVVIEAVTKGVVETSLDSFFHRSFDEMNRSKVVVGRLKTEHKHLIPKAVDFSKSKLGLAYDDVFDISNDKYYCSELIYDAFKYSNNNEPIFQLQQMTYKDPETDRIFPIWENYFKALNVSIPEGELGLNPGGMSISPYIEIVHFYGRPQGFKGQVNE